ncbi:hypothetical protein GCM10007897_36070 [Sphingobium jiangsuense]|uniref:Transglycosylase SLT domain-containing protein n=1 Tax=Sphingobium jiangsuense TaxID=870476 RepID=A0A7W6BKI2_9SPHN|nr:lytic transglycosylase domain-containing protein [Sphingobium jiangsuense]MBB3928741.1 hypothetical protein [Sphingobium jiangsuense]GLT02202.1 hypothetical protein GCM10007897_36070 [Sphingobium jiangsuense]
MAGLLSNPGPLAAIADAPTFLDREIQRSLGRAQVEQAQTQTAMLRQQAAMEAEGRMRERQMQREVNAALASGDSMAISKLIARYPQYKDALKASWDQMDLAEQRSNMRQAAGIWSALSAGNIDEAIRQLEGRIAADREAGADTSDDEQQLALLKSGNPQAINSVKGRLSLFMASVVPDKFASVVQQLGGGKPQTKIAGYGDRLIDEDGNVLYTAPDAPFTLNAGDTRFGPSGGGDMMPGDDIISSMLPITMASESGGRDYAADGSVLTSSAGAQGRMQVMPGTQADPGFGVTPARDGSMEEKARVGADYLRAMMQRYGGDPAKAWAAYNAGPGRVDAALAQGGDWLSRLPAETRAYVNKNMVQLRNQSGGTSGGGARVVAAVPTQPKERTRILSPQEVQSMGLDPRLRYQQSADGNVTLIGGQDTRTRQGRAVPDSTAKRVTANIDVRNSLERALRGFKDDYAGNTWLGGLENTLQGIFGTGTPGQRDWWADFRSTDNLIRNDLFGSALTAQEKAAYEATTISERMDPGEVRKNLQRRLQIIKGALARQQNFLKKNGYESEAVDALFASDALDGGQSSPVRVRSVQEANALKPGTLYIAPDGKTRRR